MDPSRGAGRFKYFEVNDNVTAIGHGNTTEGGSASDALLEVSLPVRSNADMQAAYNAVDSVSTTAR